jgi:hypothetical protein
MPRAGVGPAHDRDCALGGILNRFLTQILILPLDLTDYLFETEWSCWLLSPAVVLP